MSDQLIRVLSVYRDSSAVATNALYQDLQRCGPAGALAVNLLRACKKSERAKVYSGMGARTFKLAAYEGKQWALEQVCQLLMASPDLVSAWGWGLDHTQPVHRHVLYVELPHGQCSFHSAVRGAGPDYPGTFCGRRGLSSQHACSFAAALLRQAVAA